MVKFSASCQFVHILTKVRSASNFPSPIPPSVVDYMDTVVVVLFVKLTKYLLSQTEVNFLGQLRHSNLVKLIGYCCEDDHRLLVYEFMFRGSLENHLFRSMLAYLLSLC